MTVYTYSEARQNLADVLKQALEEGRVQIRRRDGTTFTIMPDHPTGSPFNVEGVDTEMTTADIIDAVRSGRERSYPS